jgi:hypothetical protein
VKSVLSSSWSPARSLINVREILQVRRPFVKFGPGMWAYEPPVQLATQRNPANVDLFPRCLPRSNELRISQVKSVGPLFTRAMIRSESIVLVQYLSCLCYHPVSSLDCHEHDHQSSAFQSGRIFANSVDVSTVRSAAARRLSRYLDEYIDPRVGGILQLKSPGCLVLLTSRADAEGDVANGLEVASAQTSKR